MSRNLYLKTSLCQAKKADRPPIWLMRQAGRYMPQYRKIIKQHELKTFIYTPELVNQVTMLPITHFQPDAAILFSDILVIIDALGLDLVYKEKVAPIVTNPIRTPDDLKKLSPKDPKTLRRGT